MIRMNYYCGTCHSATMATAAHLTAVPLYHASQPILLGDQACSTEAYPLLASLLRFSYFMALLGISAQLLVNYHGHNCLNGLILHCLSYLALYGPHGLAFQ